MKKNRPLYILIGIVLLIIVNTVLYLSLNFYNTPRIINIVFLNVSIILYLLFTIISSEQGTAFFNYAKFPIVSLYTTLTFIISSLLIFFNTNSIKLVVIIQVILLGLFIILMCMDTIEKNNKDNLNNNQQ